MTINLNSVKIFVRPGATDLRKAVNGLAVIIEQQMEGKPFSGNVYLFCNRERKLLKAVWWDRNGFWLSQKRLEKDKYPWPDTREAARELSGEELSMLLAGIDFFKAHKELYYKKVS
ncbi:MAG: IS66 family insertion sequence element accessory protein TnpB [Spirochaetaceae bacterium]|nr:IS66 family insertion sequence element accessory protein TnpB [Spirochaetaceae bacterium]